jgi:hypothetical protein
MVQEKKAENECRTIFRCKSIPAKVLEPLFEKINTANAKRRQKIIAESIEITKQREAPFSFWLRDKAKMMKKSGSESDLDDLNPECRRASFQANPIPKACSVLIYKKKMEKEEQERKKRINEQAEISYGRASMPSRM